MRRIHVLLAGVMLALTALFPATASACWPPQLTSVFWAEAPEAQPGEVVLRVRFARMEDQPGHSEITSLCGMPYEPKVTVLDVVAVAEGEFAPAEITLLGWHHAPADGGWIVGKPMTLDYAKFVYTKEGEPPLPPPVSIAWRCPPPTDYSCRPPPTDIYKDG